MKRLDAKDFDHLLAVLRAGGYTVIGPRVRDGAIVYDKLASANELPRGWRDEQQPGRYRLVQSGGQALFDFASSPQSWKQFLFPPRERLFSAVKDKQEGMRILAEPADANRFAFLGVRACDVAAIAVQDRVFAEGAIRDESYTRRRERAFIVAVQCTTSAATCFCASTHTGPEARGGFDLALTEVVADEEHFFVIGAGSNAGEKVLVQLARRGVLTEAGEPAEAEARARVARAGTMQTRRIDPRGVKEALAAHPEHTRWDAVAARCLNCANCTLACPTCFCSTVEDTTDLTGDHAERWRRWDSCFTLDHSYIHGGPVRPSARSRYRQWLTHKLSTWWEQFGTSGCVGCGRCITWCPVGIDITEEAEALLRHEDHQGPA